MTMSLQQNQPDAQSITQSSRPTVTLPQQVFTPTHSTSTPQSPSHAISHPENTVFSNGDPRNLQMNRIRRFLISIGGRQNLQPDYAKSRLSAISFAVISGDLLYLIVHQIFCLWPTK